VVAAATPHHVVEALEEQAARLRAELAPRVEVTTGG
jgi:hypothetical protein